MQRDIKIEAVKAREILDSRGNPTVEVEVFLNDGYTVGRADVPSGASTGEFEAVELRDGDSKRYGGKGVTLAVKNVNTVLADAVEGLSPFDQRNIDRILIDTDGSENKSNLGANALLGVSLAVARAAANYLDMPLYRYLGGSNAVNLPTPMANILNGGAHSDNSVDFQEFLIVPAGAPTFKEAVRWMSETFHTLKKILEKKGYQTSVGDEGGFAPMLKSNEEAIDLIVEAIAAAGYEPGKDIYVAIDPAPSSFYDKKAKIYDLHWSGEGKKTAEEMVKKYKSIMDKYPMIISLEDGMGDDDWEGFQLLHKTLGDKMQVMGDDIFVTNTKYIQKGIDMNIANSTLIKLNQIGTVSETYDAVDLAYRNGWACIVSHRSGETADTFIADLTVALGATMPIQIKTGSLSRTERLEKYNQLMRIEEEIGEGRSHYRGMEAFYQIRK